MDMILIFSTLSFSGPAKLNPLPSRSTDFSHFINYKRQMTNGKDRWKEITISSHLSPYKLSYAEGDLQELRQY